jgi:hypothetical protein
MYTPADKMYLVMTSATMFKIPKADYMKIWDRVAPQWESLTGQEEKKLELMNKVANYIMEKHPEIAIEKRLAEITCS